MKLLAVFYLIDDCFQNRNRHYFQSYRKTLNRTRQIIKWPQVEVLTVSQGFLKLSIRWMILLKGDEYMNCTEKFSVSKLHAIVSCGNKFEIY
jgi:hypothetical protein